MRRLCIAASTATMIVIFPGNADATCLYGQPCPSTPGYQTSQPLPSTPPPAIYDQSGSYRGDASRNSYGLNSTSNPYSRYSNPFALGGVNNPYTTNQFNSPRRH